MSVPANVVASNDQLFCYFTGMIIRPYWTTRRFASYREAAAWDRFDFLNLCKLDVFQLYYLTTGNFHSVRSLTGIKQLFLRTKDSLLKFQVW